MLDIFGSEGKEEAIAAQVFYPITELGKRQTMADAKFIPAPVTKIIMDFKISPLDLKKLLDKCQYWKASFPMYSVLNNNSTLFQL